MFSSPLMLTSTDEVDKFEQVDHRLYGYSCTLAFSTRPRAAQESLSRLPKSDLSRAAIGWAEGHCQFVCIYHPRRTPPGYMKGILTRVSLQFRYLSYGCTFLLLNQCDCWSHASIDLLWRQWQCSSSTALLGPISYPLRDSHEALRGRSWWF